MLVRRCCKMGSVIGLAVNLPERSRIRVCLFSGVEGDGERALNRPTHSMVLATVSNRRVVPLLHTGTR